MGRIRGTFLTSANYEVRIQSPYDGRQLVETYADLTNSDTWKDHEDLVWLYDGAIVSVAKDTDSTKNGLYFLKDAANYTDANSWIKLAGTDSDILGITNIGSGYGIYSGTTATGIANLRSITGSGSTTVSLLSGTTLVINSEDTGLTTLNDDILDYDEALNAYKPYSGYNSGVTFYYGNVEPTNVSRLNLNANLTVSELRLSSDLNISIHNIGDIYWDTGYTTMAIQHSTDVVQQVGQELLLKVVNETGTIIPNGSVVYMDGSDNGKPLIKLARANRIDDNEIIREIVGVTTENIPNNSEGFVTIKGTVRKLDTSSYNIGDILYLSEVNWGGLTKVKPEYPDYAIEVALVTKIGVTDGEILIRIIDVSVQQYTRSIENALDTDYTATTRSDVVMAYTTSNIYLPSLPYTGLQITVVDADGDASVNIITIYGNGKQISGTDFRTKEDTAIIDSDWGSVTMVYNGTFWSIISFTQ